MKKLKRHTALVTTVCVAVAVACVALPASAQEGIEHDPGFDHNRVGRNLGGGFLPDTGNYCGPLPGPVCHGGSDYWWTVDDPFTPTVWANHSGNASAVALAQKKGLPLQTFTVLLPNGEPASGATVEFSESGYVSKGIRGVTDENGRFQIAVKKLRRNHKFVARVAGFDPAGLEVLSNELRSAEHRIVLSAERSFQDIRRVAVVGDPIVPKSLAKDYRKAEKALEKGHWREAAAELTALVQRWPVGTLQDGGEYSPKDLLVSALEGAGQTGLAEEIDRRQYQVVRVQTTG